MVVLSMTDCVKSTVFLFCSVCFFMGWELVFFIAIGGRVLITNVNDNI